MNYQPNRPIHAPDPIAAQILRAAHQATAEKARAQKAADQAAAAANAATTTAAKQKRPGQKGPRNRIKLTPTLLRAAHRNADAWAAKHRQDAIEAKREKRQVRISRAQAGAVSR